MTARLERRYAIPRAIEGNDTWEQFMNALTQRDTPVRMVELRDAAGEALPRITGYSSIFGVDTVIESFFGSFRERIKKGAFTRALREKQNVRALRNHDPDNLLGTTLAKTVRLSQDDIGLFAQIDPPNTTVGRDTVEMIRRGDLTGQSFAFIVRKQTWFNGESGEPDLRIIEDVDLFDVGPVTYPAYATTTVDVEAASAIHQEGIRSLGRTPERKSWVVAVNLNGQTSDPEKNISPSNQATTRTADELAVRVEAVDPPASGESAPAPEKDPEAPPLDDAAHPGASENEPAPATPTAPAAAESEPPAEVAPTEQKAVPRKGKLTALLEATRAARAANDNAISILTE